MKAYTRQKRIAALEYLISQDTERLREETDLRIWNEERQARIDLIKAFPPEYRKQLIRQLRENEDRDDGIHELLIHLQNGVWESPSKIPAAAAEVYLTEPKATPWLRCKACRVLLPTRSGFWIKENVDGFWQGNLRYFQECPGCGGQIIHRGTEKPVEFPATLPLRPEPPWSFVDDVGTEGKPWFR